MVQATVLVVEDEPGIRDLVELILSAEGYRVVTAANGWEGLERVAQDAPDLVLLDFMMPLVDGPEVLRALASEPATARVPVVLASSVPEATALQACRNAPFTAFLQKPYSIPHLIDVVRRFVPSAGRPASG